VRINNTVLLLAYAGEGQIDFPLPAVQCLCPAIQSPGTVKHVAALGTSGRARSAELN
jgi:hypothetical protein